MSISLLMDVHVRRAVTEGLRKRGVDVLTAQEDDSGTLDDADLLDRAAVLDRVLFSQDEDLLSIASHRQQNGTPFSGIVYAHPMRVTEGQAIRDLELIAQVYDPVDMENRVEYLPL